MGKCRLKVKPCSEQGYPWACWVRKIRSLSASWLINPVVVGGGGRVRGRCATIQYCTTVHYTLYIIQAMGSSSIPGGGRQCHVETDKERQCQIEAFSGRLWLVLLGIGS